MATDLELNGSQSSADNESKVSRLDDDTDRSGGGAVLPRTTAAMGRAGMDAPAAANASEVPRIKAEPRTLRFTAAPGEESAPATTRLTNIGGQPFRIEDLMLEDAERSGFVVYGVGSDIAPGETIEVQVAFRPHARKSLHDRLRVIGNSGVKAASISLRGKVVSAEKAREARASGIVERARQWKYPPSPKTFAEMRDALAAASELMDGGDDEHPDPFDYTHARELAEPVVRELDDVASFERVAELKRKLALNGVTQQVVDARVGSAKLAARTFLDRAILGGSINGAYTLQAFEAGREEILLLTGEKTPERTELTALDAAADTALKGHLVVTAAPPLAGAAAVGVPLVATEAGLLWYTSQQALTGVTTWALANPLVATELAGAAVGLGLDVAESGPQNFWTRLEDPQQFAFLAVQLFIDYASVKGAQADWDAAGHTTPVTRGPAGDARPTDPPRMPSGRPAGTSASHDGALAHQGDSVPMQTTVQRLRALVELVAEKRGVARIGEGRIGVHGDDAPGLSPLAETVISIPPPLQTQVDRVARVEKGAAYESAMDDLRRMYQSMEVEAQGVVAVRGERTDGRHVWNYGNDTREFSHGVTSIEVRIHLDGDVNGVPPVEMALLKDQVVEGVDRYYNFQHDVATGVGGTNRLHVEVSFVDAPAAAHLTVTVHRGDGPANLENWFVEGNPTTHAHEIGHGAFGLWDESVDSGPNPNPWRATPSSPLVHHDASLMGNYWEGAAHGPVVPQTSLKPRHLEEVSGGIADARRATPGTETAATASPLASRPSAPEGDGGQGERRSTADLTGSVERRIAREDPGRFVLRYSAEEVAELATRGRQLGLSDTVVEHMIFVGCREAKPIAAPDLMQQLESYATVVRPRGFPHRFETREKFQEFEERLRSGLATIGLPTTDVRVQGSAMRTPAAKDVDVAILLDDDAFDDVLVRSFAGRAREGGALIDFAARRNDLNRLAARIEQDHDLKGGAFNALARTFSYAYRVRKMRPDDVRGLESLIEQLEASFGPLDISVMSRNGSFDVEPYQVMD